MTDLSQTSGRCSDNQLFPVGSCSIHDFDPHSVGRESVVGVQLTSWGDHQLVVAALDVGQPVLARYRHSRSLSVEHGQDSWSLNGTVLGRCGQKEMFNKLLGFEYTAQTFITKKLSAHSQ